MWTYFCLSARIPAGSTDWLLSVALALPPSAVVASLTDVGTTTTFPLGTLLIVLHSLSDEYDDDGVIGKIAEGGRSEMESIEGRTKVGRTWITKRAGFEAAEASEARK